MWPAGRFRWADPARKIAHRPVAGRPYARFDTRRGPISEPPTAPGRGHRTAAAGQQRAGPFITGTQGFWRDRDVRRRHTGTLRWVAGPPRRGQQQDVSAQRRRLGVAAGRGWSSGTTHFPRRVPQDRQRPVRPGRPGRAATGSAAWPPAAGAEWLPRSNGRRSPSLARNNSSAQTGEQRGQDKGAVTFDPVGASPRRGSALRVSGSAATDAVGSALGSVFASLGRPTNGIGLATISSEV